MKAKLFIQLNKNLSCLSVSLRKRKFRYGFSYDNCSEPDFYFFSFPSLANEPKPSVTCSLLCTGAFPFSTRAPPERGKVP